MPVVLPTPITANETQRVSLNNILYDITYRYNTRDERWRIDLAVQGETFVTGIKVMENQLLLGQFLLSEYIQGELFCVRNEDDDNPVGRDNFGLGKAYELLYLTPDEVNNLEGS